MWLHLRVTTEESSWGGDFTLPAQEALTDFFCFSAVPMHREEREELLSPFPRKEDLHNLQKALLCSTKAQTHRMKASVMVR